MTKYLYAERVIKKVRRILRYDVRFKDFIHCPPSISVDGDTLCLDNISWDYYEMTLLVTSTHIIFVNRNNRTVLFEYDSFDELLKFN